MAKNGQHAGECKRWGPDSWIDLEENRLTGPEAEEVRKHLDSCPTCRNSIREFRSIQAVFQEEEILPSPGLHEAILDKVRERQTLPRGVQGGSPALPGVFRGSIRRALAAAVLLLAIAGFLFLVTRGGKREDGGSEPGHVTWPRDAEISPPTSPRRSPSLKDPMPSGVPEPEEAKGEVEKTPVPDPGDAPSSSPPTQAPGRDDLVERPEPAPVEKPAPPAEVRRPVDFIMTGKAGTLRLSSGPAGFVDLMQGDDFDGSGAVSFRAETGPTRVEFGGHFLSVREGASGSVAFFGSAWEITLEAGELFCEVDPARKADFSVLFRHGSVRATGTAFGVSVGEGRARVSVSKGRVEVSNPHGAAVLDAAHVSLLRSSGAPEVSREENRALPPWLERLRPNALVRLHRAKGMGARPGWSRLGPRHGRDRKLARRYRNAHLRLSVLHRRGMSARAPREKPGFGAGRGGRRPGRNGGGGGGGGGGPRAR